ncbi:MAG: exopolyphosphatase [Rhodospirillales bacterium]|nr:exopolyphosphatase [Rhodospirillales bacterium]
MDAGPPRGVPEPGAKYRLVTRSDFDGLVCAVILEQLDMIDDILFVHPNDMQEGRIDITSNDITTNLPYVPGCYLSFDHHMSEITRLGKKHDNHIIIPEAPSAARVVYEYYGGADALPKVSTELMDAVDQGDSAQYNMEEVLNPQRWALINFIMDSRTGLGRFRGFRIPNYELMMSLIEYCQEKTIEQILEIEDVKERVEFYREQAELFKGQVKRCSSVHGNLVVLDLREEETVFVGNRFMIYALMPQCNISMHVMWGRDKQNVVFAVGKSIFDRSSKTNIGDLMLKYGGGGHHAAGTCQSDPLLANTIKNALIQKINQDG